MDTATPHHHHQSRMVLVDSRSDTAHDMFIDMYGDKLYELFLWLKTELGPHGMMDIPASKTGSLKMYHTFVDAVFASLARKTARVPRTVDSI